MAARRTTGITLMRVSIFGSTGRIGSLVLADVLAAGHDVMVLTRRPGAVKADHRMQVIAGDIGDATAVARAIDGSEAVIAALGPRTNDPDAEEELELGMRNLVAAMAGGGVSRLIALSGAAVDVPGDAKPVVDRVVSRVVRLAARHVVGAKQREFAVFAASDLDWTALRPAIVTDGDARGYRLSERLQPGARVTRRAVAAAMVAQMHDRAHLRKAPFVLPGAPTRPEGRSTAT
jgi:putative NADH-flavin reductase